MIIIASHPKGNTTWHAYVENGDGRSLCGQSSQDTFVTVHDLAKVQCPRCLRVLDMITRFRDEATLPVLPTSGLDSKKKLPSKRNLKRSNARSSSPSLPLSKKKLKSKLGLKKSVRKVKSGTHKK